MIIRAIAIVVALCLTQVQSTRAQGEYVELGYSAVTVGTVGIWHKSYNAYGLYVGGVSKGKWDGNIHFVLGNEHGTQIQQYGLEVSVYAGKLETHGWFFGSIGLGLDNVSFPSTEISAGYSRVRLSNGFVAVYPSVNLFFPAGRHKTIVPAIRATMYCYMGTLPPDPTPVVQAQVGFRTGRSETSTVFTIAPGIGYTTQDGHTVTSVSLSLGLLFQSKSIDHSHEKW